MDVLGISPQRKASVAHALERGDLASLERLESELWCTVPRSHGPQLLSLVSRLRPQVLDRHPQILLGGYQAHVLSAGSRDSRFQGFWRTWGDRFALTLPTFTRPADIIAAGIISITGARLRGDYAEAERRSQRIDEALARRSTLGSAPWDRDPAAHQHAWLAPQRTLTALLQGRADDAMTSARIGYEQNGPDSLRFPRAVSASHAALLSALAGSRRHAIEWLRKEERLRNAFPDVAAHSAPAVRLTRVVLALDRLDESAAEDGLMELGDAAASVELWPFLATAWARYDLLFGSANFGLIRLDDTLLAQGASSALPEIAGGVLLHARAELLLAAGEAQSVVMLAARHPSNAALRISAARAHLRGGQSARAVRAASAPLRRSTMTRQKLDHLLVLAAAQRQRGQLEDALSLFSAACEHLDSSGILSALRGIPEDAIRDLSQRISRPALAESVGTRSSAPETPQVALFDLTRRELVVLRALASGDTLQEIASQLSVSINTVRSQVRSVYRKLGVSSRADAVAIGTRSGLIERSSV